MIEQDERPPTPWPPLQRTDMEIVKTAIHNPDFFSFRFRDILEILVIIGLGVGFLLTQTGRSVSLEGNLSNLTNTVDKLASHVDDIDKRGTQQGQSFQHATSERNIDQDRRINTMENQLATVIPDLREIKTKLNFVADLITENKSKDKK